MSLQIKDQALSIYTNMRGWRTKRKLVIFESDDWGAIRMPSRKVYKSLLTEGVRVDRSLYDRLDCLENLNDFMALMNVLADHRDITGSSPVFTLNTVMGNPDFEAIENEGFERFAHQHLFDSYRYYHGEDLEPYWNAAISQGLIQPQFHGREHLNSILWLRDLRQGFKETCVAFRHRFYGLTTTTSSCWQKHYKAAYWAETPEEMAEINRIVSDGLRIFENTFQFKSKTMVACNYVLPKELEMHLAKEGIAMIQTQRGYVQPSPKAGGKPRICHRFTGQKNQFKQRYSVRNVLFEPYLNSESDWVGLVLADMAQAFRFGKPAVICTHRINYTSGMDSAHRNHSLKLLDLLLKAISKRWPDVEYMSSDDLVAVIASST
ncbi:hypothetical protein [Halomonas maura]|uniref:hypothetical protein n=1 Tax=Halomonas maura TaxID=117606 RepID=UPI0025B56397|nr:hypothetical protein [Halomonas maura]MDN3555229.1 hypothetical protein [Halomonas maura]